MKIKRLFLGLIMIALAVALVACGNGGNNGGDKKEYDITVWVGESIVDLTKQQIAAYNALETTEYKFNATVNPVSESKAGATVIEDVEKAADIYCFAQDQLARLVEASAISKLGQAASKFVEDNNDGGSVAASKVGDAVYAYPLSSDNGYFMFYDKRYINEEHLDDIAALMKDCEDANKNFSFKLEDAWYTASFFFATGCVSEWSTQEDGTFNAAHDTFKSNAGVVALKGIRDIVTKAKWVNSADNDFSKEDTAGASAIVISGTWISASVEETLGANMGVTDLPSYKVGDVSYHLGSFAGYKLMAVKPQSDATKQAQLHKLAQYLSGEQCQSERFDAVQWGPSNKVAQATDKVKNNAPLAALAKQSQYAIPQGQFPNLWWEIAGTLGAACKEVAADAADSVYEGLLADYFTAISAIANTDGKKHTNIVWADHTWGVVGSFAGSNWGADGDDVPLVASADGKTYTSTTITFAEGDTFKVRADGAWTTNIGQKGELDGDNFTIEEAGDYVIKMTIDDDNNATIVAVSSKMTYGVVGGFAASGWGSSPDIAMTETETAGTFTAEVELAANDEFKIRGNNSWDSGVNLGSDGADGVKNAGDSGNWKVTEAGTYVITLVVGADGTYTVTWTKK